MTCSPHIMLGLWKSIDLLEAVIFIYSIWMTQSPVLVHLFIYVLMLVFIWFFSFSSFLRSLTHRVVQLLSRQIALTFMSWHIWWFTTYSINCSISLIFTANFRSRTCEPSHPHSTMDCLLEVQVLQSFNWQNFLNYSWIMPSQNQPTATNDHLWKIYRCSLIKFNKFCNLH